ncbi:MAG: hypothetical protein H7A51_04215 [Akkermansiaceae bacterium]|nr:hypothetical protein [Akkermansiaceae bacterium]
MKATNPHVKATNPRTYKIIQEDMNNIEQEREESAPLGPNGPAETDFSSNSSPCQIRNNVYKTLILSHGVNAAAILTKLLYWTSKSIKKNGSRWCFRSAAALAEDIGGISASAVWDQLQKLKQMEALEIRSGRPRGSLNAASEFYLKPGITEIVGSPGPASDGSSSSAPYVRFGLDDANNYGIGQALLLYHLEWVLRQRDDDNAFIRTRLTSEYLGVQQKQIQRWINSLRDKGVLVEHEGRGSRRHLRFADGLNRKPVDIDVDSVNQRKQKECLERARSEGLPENHPLVQDAKTPCDTGVVMFIEAEEPELNFGDTDDVLRYIVSKNSRSQVALDESIVREISSLIRSLDIMTVVGLGSMGADGTESYFRERSRPSISSLLDEHNEHPHRESPQTHVNSHNHPDLCAELFTLALQLRRRPWLPSSSPSLRRVAYGLALEIQSRLGAIHDERIRLLEEGHTPEDANPDSTPQEKRRCLEAVLTCRNQIGIEIPASSGFECPNPEIRRDYIQRVKLGLAAAEGFFKKNTECAVAEIIGMLDACAKVPPKPDDGYSQDQYKYARKGTRLDSFFRNFERIADQLE